MSKPTNASSRRPQGGRSGRGRRFLRPARVLSALAIILAFLTGMFVWGFYYFLTYDLPNLSSLKDYTQTVPLLSTVYADDGYVIGEFYRERRRYVPFEEMPRSLINAFVAAEDQRFFEHKGLDYMGITRAFITNLKASETRQGGSTLTQQLARTFFLSREKSIIRKLKEAILATRMEAFLTKEEILNLYMNQIYLGHGAYGVEAAAENYFGKTVQQLNLAEMSLIAAMPKAPSRLNPYKNPKGAVARQRYVIHRMESSKFITKDQADDARQTRLVVNPRPNPSLEEAPYFTEMVRQYLIKLYGAEKVYEGGLEIHTTLNRADQKAAELAVERGLRELDRRLGFRGPLGHLAKSEVPDFLAELDKQTKAAKGRAPLKGVVETIARNGKSARVSIGAGRTGTLALADMAWARPADPNRPTYRISSVGAALSEGDIIRVRIKERDPEEQASSTPVLELELDQEPAVQASLVAMLPGTGRIRAWVGGRDFRQSQFDRVYQSHRQPGSAFKPIVYTTALDRGFSPSTIIIDSPISFTDTAGNIWAPQNYDHKFKGPITVRDALAHSRNVPAVKVAARVGIEHIIRYAYRLGISSPLAKNLSLALGAGEVSLFELTRAYAVFPSMGKRVRPVFIRKILDRNGRMIAVNRRVPDTNPGDVSTKPPSMEERLRLRRTAAGPDDFPPGNAISRSTAYQMTDLLQGVVRFGTGRRMQALGRPAAGKTGTTNDLRDAWFIGFTPQLVAGAWVGYDQERPIGYKETGGRAAGPIWLYFMEKALEGEPVLDFEVPKTITFARVNYHTGLPSVEGDGGRTIFEVFKQGQEPPVRREAVASSEGSSTTTDPLRPPPVDFFRRDFQ
jgi:penicillin-binding protein 1A